jgi:hypothetical protein
MTTRCDNNGYSLGPNWSRDNLTKVQIAIKEARDIRLWQIIKRHAPKSYFMGQQHYLEEH